MDLSDIRATVRIEALSACAAGLELEFLGFVSGGQSFFVDINPMSHISVVSNLSKKADADLYVYDYAGFLYCSSLQPKATRIADQCFYLDDTCDLGYFSTVEVYGFNKKNDFHLAVWFVDAY